jgi:hypothetical protein
MDIKMLELKGKGIKENMRFKRAGDSEFIKMLRKVIVELNVI